MSLFIEQGAFDPETTLAMGRAYDKACSELGLFARPHPVTARIAEKILEVARRGERDPDKLCSRAICGLVENV